MMMLFGVMNRERGEHIQLHAHTSLVLSLFATNMQKMMGEETYSVWVSERTRMSGSGLIRAQ